MKKPTKRNLHLRIETVRALGLVEVHGGLPTDPATAGDTGCPSEATSCVQCASDNCTKNRLCFFTYNTCK
jgi:hypothetical protein